MHWVPPGRRRRGGGCGCGHVRISPFDPTHSRTHANRCPGQCASGMSSACRWAGLLCVFSPDWLFLVGCWFAGLAGWPARLELLDWTKPALVALGTAGLRSLRASKWLILRIWLIRRTAYLHIYLSLSGPEQRLSGAAVGWSRLGSRSCRPICKKQCRCGFGSGAAAMALRAACSWTKIKDSTHSAVVLRMGDGGPAGPGGAISTIPLPTRAHATGCRCQS